MEALLGQTRWKGILKSKRGDMKPKKQEMKINDFFLILATNLCMTLEIVKYAFCIFNVILILN